MKKMFFGLGVLLLMMGTIGFVREAHGQESALQGQLPRLGVVQFDTNINIPKVNQDAVTVRNLVESQMVATRRYQVITRTDIDRLLENQQIQVSSISSTENIRKLQLQNISYIVTGSVNAMDNDYLITIKMLDVSSGEFNHSADTFTASASRDLYNGVTKLISDFVAGMTSQGGQVTQTTPPSVKTYKVGDAGPGGGIIFAVEGNTGMEVSRLLGEYTWSEAVNAAKNYRGGGYSDWYLPSKTELSLIYDNLQKAGVMSLGSTWYWSSSRYGSSSSWGQYFGDGRQDNYSKNTTYSVRCVRAF